MHSVRYTRVTAAFPTANNAQGCTVTQEGRGGLCGVGKGLDRNAAVHPVPPRLCTTIRRG